MEVTQALEVLTALADGVDPVTGEIFPDDSPYHQPEILRALFVAIQTLEHRCRRETRKGSLPAKAGEPWSGDEDTELLRGFDARKTVPELAKHHERTRGAIMSRLVRLGKFP
jgi:hypothetical protein